MKNAADLSHLCSTTTTEASEVQAKLLELSTSILQSNHSHSALLRDLISRQHDLEARVIDEIRSLASTLGGTGSSAGVGSSTGAGSSAVLTPPPSADTHAPDYQDNSDNASITSRRSTRSLWLGQATYLEDLKESRAYKRLRYFGLDLDSSANSVLTFDSSFSAGNWSILSDITLGDLSVSEIAVLNLPIDLADISNPEPFLEPNSTETNRRSRPKPRRIWSSRGRIHNAIENGNGFVVRTLLAMGMDVEELDSNSRTPLIHATVKCQESICKSLLEKGASVEALKAFTNGMDLKERFELLDQSLRNAMNGGLRLETTLRMLVLMAVGTNGGGDDNRSSNRSMMNVAIDMSYGLAVRAIIHLEPRMLMEIDTEGRTPFAYAYYLRRNEICEMLLGSSKLDIVRTTEDVKLEGNIARRAHAAIEEGCPQILRLLLGASADIEGFIDMEGRTPLVHAAQLAFNSKIDEYESLEDICRVLLDATNIDIEAMKKMNMTCIAVSMHHLADKGYKSVLQLLSFAGSRDAEGWTPLAWAAFNLNEALCQFLVEKGCTLCLDTEQKEQLKSKLSCRIHDAANGGHDTALQLLLDMGADINERNKYGETALLEAVHSNHLSCAKILTERGADTGILTSGSSASVLHRAAWTSTDSEMMKVLLSVAETRKLVNLQDDFGYTALHYCSSGANQSPAVRLENAKMLVQAGALLTIKNSTEGVTPYEDARGRERRELAKYLWSQLSPWHQAREIPPPSDS